MLQSPRKPSQPRFSIKSDPKNGPANPSGAAPLIRGVTVSDATDEAPRDQS